MRSREPHVDPGRAGVRGTETGPSQAAGPGRAVCTAAAAITIYVLTDPALVPLVTTHLCLHSPIFQ